MNGKLLSAVAALVLLASAFSFNPKELAAARESGAGAPDDQNPAAVKPKKSFFGNFLSGIGSILNRFATVFRYKPATAVLPSSSLAANAANALAATSSSASSSASMPASAPNTNQDNESNQEQAITSLVSSFDLTNGLQNLETKLLAKIKTIPTPIILPSPDLSSVNARLEALQQQVALSQRINALSGSSASPLTITGPTITGASITGASISGSSNVSGTLSGTFTGGVVASSLVADTSTLILDATNDRIGIGTTSPADTLSVNGAVYLAPISAPSTATDRLYNTSSSLYWGGSLVGGATVGTWTLSGSNVYRASGNVGIGTTSPYTKLSVVGEVAAQKFTATSTNATSTFNGALNIASTTAAGAGTILVNGTRFLHNYGPQNLFLGSGAGNMTMSGYQNVGIGEGVLRNTTTGYRNTAVGFQSLPSNTTGYQNSALGSFSLYNTTGYQNSALGSFSLYSNTTGYQNSASGSYSLYSNTTGYKNSALGYFSLYYNTTGYQNSALGSYSLYYNTTGYRNTALGYVSLYYNTTGYQNSASGSYSLYSNTTGYKNSALGSFSLYSNTTGIRNTASGYNAGRANTTGSANSFFGYNAGYTGTTATISSSTAIGYEAQVATSSSLILGGTGVFNTWVGTGTTSPAAKFSIGQPANTSQGGIWLAATDGDFRSTYMDTSGVMNFYGGDGGTLNTATLNAAGAWTNASDLAYKENVAALDYGLETLRLLSPRSYTMKGSGLKQIGFVAQELEPFIPEVVSGEEGSKGISYGNLVSVVVKAVQDLDRRVTDFASTTVANVNAGASALSSAVTEWVGEKVTVAWASIKELVAERIKTKDLEVENGIVLTDSKTGEKYCLKISDGEFAKEKGDCPPLGSSTPKLEGPNSSPVITINGNNPAEIEVGTAYSDLGVIARDSEGRDLSIRNFVNGALVDQISLDTSISTTYTIDYAATDNNGVTATSTRVVNVINNGQQPTTGGTNEEDAATTTPAVSEPTPEPTPEPEEQAE